MRRVLLSLVWCVALAVTAAAGEPARLQQLDAPIVNGVATAAFPSVALVASARDGAPACSGTLIGCRTVLTAAHCLCPADGSPCTPDVAAAGLVFLQSGGIYRVESAVVHPAFRFGEGGDLALLRLDRPVEGVRPTPLNAIGRPPAGSTGVIVGFGRSAPGGLGGIKRAGAVTTSACPERLAAGHLCWEFTAPLGAAGQDANTCQGDSGGPLLMNFGAGEVVAGVTSGGENTSCQPPDLAFQADVFPSREWIRSVAGGDLDGACGGLPEVGGAQVVVMAADGELSAANGRDDYTVEVPPGIARLRVTLNGEHDPAPAGGNDFDLLVRRGAPGSDATFDCRSAQPLPLEACDVEAPAAGAWVLSAERYSGAGAYQLTATLFAAPSAAPEPCVPGPRTLCIDGAPGDRRFRVETTIDTALAGGTRRLAEAIPLTGLGIERGGLFTFFSAGNPEMLVKVLPGCAVNGSYWVFFAAATNAGFTVTVTDTRTGRRWSRTNPDQTPAAPVQDPAAFPCS